jgi:hypothetical protein
MRPGIAEGEAARDYFSVSSLFNDLQGGKFRRRLRPDYLRASASPIPALSRGAPGVEILTAFLDFSMGCTTEKFAGARNSRVVWP